MEYPSLKQVQVGCAFAAALALFVYIVLVATTKRPLPFSWLA